MAIDRKIESDYEVMTADNYALGVDALRKKCRVPFSFEQNVEAKVQDYEAKGDASEFFGTHLDSITGIAYKAYCPGKFKIKLVCEELKSINADFNKNFLPVDYDSFDGMELDTYYDKYNQELTRVEAKFHNGWLAVMNGNQDLLAKFVDIWFNKTSRHKGMGFYIHENPQDDELRAVVLHGINLSCIGGDINFLDDTANFISKK